VTPYDLDEPTVGWSDVPIAFRPLTLTNVVVCRQRSQLRHSRPRRSGQGGWKLALRPEIRKIILMNEGVTACWGTIPSGLAIVRLFEQRVKYRGGSPIGQGGTNDDSGQDMACNHGLFIPYPPCNKAVFGLSGGRIRHRFVSIVAANPAENIRTST